MLTTSFLHYVVYILRLLTQSVQVQFPEQAT